MNAIPLALYLVSGAARTRFNAAHTRFNAANNAAANAEISASLASEFLRAFNAAGTFTEADTWEAIGINEIGTLIAPADGSVTLPKLSAGTGTVGQFLKTDGVGTLSWSTVASTTAGDITTANNFFQNWNTIDADTTSTFATTINAAIIGPISVTGSFVWTVNGTLNIL